MLLRRLLFPVAVIVCLITPTVARAEAPYEHERFSGSGDFEDSLCGLDVTIHEEFTGLRIVRTVKDSGGNAFLAHNNYEVVETVTNVANSNKVILTTNGNFLEQHAAHVEGNIWLYEISDVGTFTMTDADGNRLLRDRGVVKVRQLFDNLGDGQPSGDVISEEVVAVHGPHSDEDAFCTALLGALT